MNLTSTGGSSIGPPPGVSSTGQPIEGASIREAYEMPSTGTSY